MKFHSNYSANFACVKFCVFFAKTFKSSFGRRGLRDLWTCAHMIVFIHKLVPLENSHSKDELQSSLQWWFKLQIFSRGVTALRDSELHVSLCFSPFWKIDCSYKKCISCRSCVQFVVDNSSQSHPLKTSPEYTSAGVYKGKCVLYIYSNIKFSWRLWLHVSINVFILYLPEALVMEPSST